MKKKPLVIALGLSSSIGLVGCGGGDDNSSSNTTPATPSTSYSVTAIDGYLQNAQVWLDLDKDFQLDANEPGATTGAGGKASLDVTGIDNPGQYPVVVRSIKGKTVDEDTGNTVASDYVMSAPAGQQDVTPLSTLVHVHLESNPTATESEAVTTVANELGIEAAAVLGDFIEDGHKDAAFGARSLVASGTLPTTTTELKTASDNSNSLLGSSKIDSIKTTIETKTDAELDDIVFNQAGNADVDTDNDGVADTDDKFPNDASEWLDSDEDGSGDNTDTDDDNDGVEDDADEMPFDENESKDSDQDGLGDNADLDDDNDGSLDTEDAFPNDGSEYLDTDGDGTGNNKDTDDDGDNVADVDDAFPLDEKESADFDQDGTGDNADLDDDNDGVNDDEDAFDFDDTESVDTDGDGIGNNADTDDDNDGVSDEDDAFDLDDKESIDTDGDGIGNNADTDDDNDGVSDDKDAFPSDPSESEDSDQDGTGNNADTDDDNDGISDEDDLDPTNPDVGQPETSKVVDFINKNSTFYSLWSENDHGNGQFFLQEFTPNGNTAPQSNLSKVNTDGTLTTVAPGVESEVLLTASGWQDVNEDYTFTIDGNNISVSPTSAPSISYSVTGTVKDLSTLLLEEYGGDWSDSLHDEDATFPQGSEAAILTLTPKQDIYELHNDSPWFWHGNDGQGDSFVTPTVAEMISDTSAGDGARSGSVKGVALGYHIGVELVKGGQANYYDWHWEISSDAPVELVDSGTWTMTTINNVDIVQFTVPDKVITAWKEQWYDRDADVLLSAYNGKVHFGSVNKASDKDAAENDVAMYNPTAKDALLSELDVEFEPCYIGDKENGATEAEFNTVLAECGGMSTPITAEMISGKNFQRERSNGTLRDYTFNADGTATVYKSEGGDYTRQWSITNGVLNLHYTDGEESSKWLWVITDQSEGQWALKTFEAASEYNNAEQLESFSSIWATVVTEKERAVNPEPTTCKITEKESGATIEEFNAQLAACTDLPTGTTQDVIGAKLTRVNGSNQTRTLIFSDNGDAVYYRNTVAKARKWLVNSEGNLELYNEDQSELLTLMRLIKDDYHTLEFATFDTDDKSIWNVTYKDVEELDQIHSCEIMDSDWNDETDSPNTYRTYEEFTQSVSACLAQTNNQTGNRAKFSDKFLEQGLTLTSINEAEDDYEEYRLNSDGTGAFVYDGNKSANATWSVDSNGILKVIITGTNNKGEAYTAHDFLAIVDTNGLEYSIKAFSRATDWKGVDANAEGDLWSGVFTPITK
ncbi:hypothetical protein MHO82_08880 [Vibrio sp. Of7-15]|uniref:hypothetical protein n=1 Tax=Vibrio sp. Of7-15 TaxID=2724879 RepID=UPI001EF30D60|nr:hypothetical protein [Vibrio sp. Of7-15]MCG7496977.1 hypothetical protein [Vibrio sp. Of7-15]